MDQFKVKIKKIGAEADQITELAENITDLEQKLINISAGVRHKIQAMSDIRKRLDLVKEKIETDAVNMNEMGTTLHVIINKYADAEKKITDFNHISINKTDMLKGKSANNLYFSGNNVANPSNAKRADSTDIFDEKSQYGGDQGDLSANKAGKDRWIYDDRPTGDQELFDFVRKYDQYRDYTDDEIAKLYKQINNEGCGYVALVNNIFSQFENQEDGKRIFEEKFGFPMYENGKYNFNKLLIDLYANTDDKYFTGIEGWEYSYSNDIINDYMGMKNGKEKLIEAYNLTGSNYNLEDNKNFSDIRSDLEDALREKYKDGVLTLENVGTNQISLSHRMEAYLDSKGLKYNYDFLYGPKKEDINKYISEGKNVNIGIEGKFTLYKENGGKKSTATHWMTITGVTEDGRYIVSSWGEKYYLKPEELKENGNNLDFIVTKSIEVK